MTEHQLDEVSKGLLGRYLKASITNRGYAERTISDRLARADYDTPQDGAKFQKRIDRHTAQVTRRWKGIKMAINKLTKEDEELLLNAFDQWVEQLTEEQQFESLDEMVEVFAEQMQLDEISKKVLGSYVNKAASSMASAHAGRMLAYKRRQDLDYTLGNSQASSIVRSHMRDMLGKDPDIGHAAEEKHFRTSIKRMRGIEKATKRLTKEDFDTLAAAALNKKSNDFIEAHHEALRARIADTVAAKKFEMQQALFGAVADDIYEEDVDALQEAWNLFCESEQLDEISKKTLTSYLDRNRTHGFYGMESKFAAPQRKNDYKGKMRAAERLFRNKFYTKGGEYKNYTAEEIALFDRFASYLEEGKSRDSDEGRRKFDKFKKYSEFRKEKEKKKED